MLPPYSFDLHPSSALVTVLVDVAYLLGGLGVGCGLLAVRRGHRLDPRRAALVGVAFALGAVLVPPTGSADHINYAAYGRIAAQGGDPYVQAPVEWHGGTDPVTRAVEPPWTTTPSVYGPVGTAIQAGTSLLGGDSLRATVWLGQLVCAGAWLLVGWLLIRFTAARAGDRSPAQSRALWLWLLNPVLYGVLLVGAHIDLLGCLRWVRRSSRSRSPRSVWRVRTVPATIRGRLGEQSEHGRHGHRLAAAALAHDRQRLALGHRERHAVDGVHGARRGVESHDEAVDREQRFAVHRRTRRVRGSRASRNQSPSRFSPRPAMMIAMPGVIDAQG